MATVQSPPLACVEVALQGWTEPGALAALAVRLGRRGASCLLDSALCWPGLGAWSFIAIGPRAVVRAGAEQGPDGLRALRRALRGLREGAPAARWRAARRQLGLPFAGGAIGWIGYEYGRRFEPRRPGRPAPPPAAQPEPPGLAFAVVPHVLALHRPSGRAWLAGVRRGFEAAARRLAAALGAGPQAAVRQAMAGLPPLRPLGHPRSSLGRCAYERAVARAVQYVWAGDVFEVNLSQRIEVALGGEAAQPPGGRAVALYARLGQLAPAPFAGLLRMAGFAVISVSPERLLRLRGRAIETRPIKGTRPRGADAAEDARLAAALRASPKDRAELAMVVDLERNDLGRVAEPGTVRVREAAGLYSFPAVHHLMARVTARLRRGRDALALLEAVFPGGSISGAPKPRAMEIIEELEPVRRGVYTGAIGWLGADGELDLNVAIRTVVLHERLGIASFGVGGAVTADSEPAAEYEETLAKGRALARALGFEIEEIAGG
ncbi:MAG: aminodeoxychorismate synthase, component I [Planctomycetota bacterium]|nr:MAG: aminodeoxychorismate synthase, component I [Planctomycetota bacterium]